VDLQPDRGDEPRPRRRGTGTSRGHQGTNHDRGRGHSRVHAERAAYERSSRVSTQTTLPPAGAQGTAQPAQRSGLTRLLIETPETGVIAACVVFFILISFKAPTFHSVGNLQVVGRDLGQTGILAIGESLVILTGGIDLSVGALAGLAGILAAWFNVSG